FDADQGLKHARDYVTFRPDQNQGEIDAQSKPHLPSAKEHPYQAATASDATSDTAERSPPRPIGRRLLVTAFGPNPYGEGTVLRFWEQAGDGGEFAVHLPRGMMVGTAQPCDLRGQPIGAPIAVSRHGVFSVKIRSMAPASFILS